MCHLFNVGTIFEAFAQDHVHYPQRESRVRPGPNRDMPVGQGGRACLVGVDHDQPRTIAAGLLHHWP